MWVEVFYRINQHLQIHNILSEDQFGFRKGLSTINAIYKINESVLKSWENKMHVGGIFLWSYQGVWLCESWDFVIENEIS